MFDTYGGLRNKGVTVFVTDAPKAFNGFLNISHVNASKSVSQVYGDGQKVDYILVRYDHDIDGASVNKNTYEVENHVVANGYFKAAIHQYEIAELFFADVRCLLY